MPERRVGNLVIIPNKFDDCDITVAIAELNDHNPDWLTELNNKAYIKGWSDARLSSEIRCRADESYWSRQPDE